jgi:hypothetical protein
MGDPFLVTDEDGVVRYGQATGSTILCGAGYLPSHWKALADGLSPNTAKSSYWITKNSNGRYLVPSAVTARSSADPANDNGVLPLLSIAQATILLNNGQVIYPDLSTVAEKVKITWATPNRARPSIAVSKFKPPK